MVRLGPPPSTARLAALNPGRMNELTRNSAEAPLCDPFTSTALPRVPSVVLSVLHFWAQANCDAETYFLCAQVRAGQIQMSTNGHVSIEALVLRKKKKKLSSQCVPCSRIVCGPYIAEATAHSIHSSLRLRPILLWRGSNWAPASTSWRAWMRARRRRLVEDVDVQFCLVVFCPS